MRFIDDGPDIPEVLLNARDEGNVVFVCGAGVSKRSGLPLFRELVDQIYRQLKTDPSDKPAEKVSATILSDTRQSPICLDSTPPRWSP